MRRLLVGAPAYFRRHGRPAHPAELARHACFAYAYMPTPDIWRFANAAGEEVSVRPAGPLRANNGDAMMACLAAGTLEIAVPGRAMRDAVLHLVTRPGSPRPARVAALIDFLVERLA